jgi:hypothetical protein
MTNSLEAAERKPTPTAAPDLAKPQVRCPFCAPSVIRTRALLLRSNPAVDPAAICDDAGQASGGTHCCRPSYLVIGSRALTTRSPAGDAVRIASKAWLATSLSSPANQALPATPEAATVRPARALASTAGGGFPFATSFPYG